MEIKVNTFGGLYYMKTTGKDVKMSEKEWVKSDSVAVERNNDVSLCNASVMHQSLFFVCCSLIVTMRNLNKASMD